MKQQTIQLEITGMTCNHCATGIEKMLEGKRGIINTSVSYSEGIGKFIFASDKTSKEKIINTINEIGSYKVKGEINENIILQSTITCPECGYQKEETMPTDACQFFYECENCKKVLKPINNDCCVYCSYGSVPCPPIQENDEKGTCSNC